MIDGRDNGTLHAFTSAAPLTRRQRACLAGCVAALSGAWVAYLRWGSATVPSDISPLVWGASAWLHGDNPFDVVARSPVWSGGLLYPFTAVVVLIPFARIPEFVLNVVWAAGTSGCLAWMLTSRGLTPPLVMMMSPAMIQAVNASQWTPLLLAATLSSWGGALLACKPTTAIWLFAYRPRWQHVAGMASLVLLSLVLWPSWPLAWRAEIAAKAVYTIWPLALPGAPLVLLALLRWRQADARLLLAMVAVPHTMLMYETLPLFLVARTWAESGALWIGSVVAMALHNAGGPYRDATQWTAASGRLIIWALYLPALVLVLRHREPARQRIRFNTGAFDAFAKQH